jgi:aryl-alcohol dehydrogenase-like predicted oxidoreductase
MWGDLYQETDRVIVERVAEVAEKRGVPRAQVALAWLLSNPTVTAPIVGATKVGHLDDAVAAVDLELDTTEIALLEEPYQPHPVGRYLLQLRRTSDYPRKRSDDLLTDRR